MFGIDAERVPFVLSVVLTGLFMAAISLRHWRRHRRIPVTHAVQFLFLSGAAGFVWGLGVMPAIVFGIRFSQGKDLQASVYPGQSADWLVGTLLLAAVVSGLIALWAAWSWPPRDGGSDRGE